MELVKFFRIYLWNSKLNIARGMEYRTDFLVGMAVNLLFTGAGPVFQYLVFQQINGFPGWSLQDILLFQGILLLVLGIRGSFLGGYPEYVQLMVQKGELDTLLLRPFSSLGMILSRGFFVENIGSVLAGAVLVAYGVEKSGASPTIWEGIGFFAAILCGLLFFLSIDILYSCMVVFLIHIGRLKEIFDNLAKFGQYPLEIFSKGMQAVLYTVLPMALWVNVPCKILLEGIQPYLFCGVSFLFAWLAGSISLWNLCMKKYTSAGG